MPYRNDEPPDYDQPEECVCGKPNSTEDGEWVDPQHPGFCGKACYDFHMAQQAEEAEGMAEAFAEINQYSREEVEELLR